MVSPSMRDVTLQACSWPCYEALMPELNLNPRAGPRQEGLERGRAGVLSKSTALLPPLLAPTTGIHFSMCLRRAGRLRQERGEGTVYCQEPRKRLGEVSSALQ